MIQLLNTPSTAEYNTNAAKGLVYVLFMRICSILLVIVIVIGSWSTVDGFSILRSRYKEGFLLNTTQLLKNTTSTNPFDKQTSSSPRSQPSVIAIALSQFPRNLERKHAIYPIWTSINCYIRNNLSWKKKSETESLRTAGPLEEFWNPSFSAVLSAVNSTKIPGAALKNTTSLIIHKKPTQHILPSQVTQRRPAPNKLPRICATKFTKPWYHGTALPKTNLGFFWHLWISKDFCLMISVGPFATLVWPVVPLSLQWLVVEALWQQKFARPTWSS